MLVIFVLGFVSMAVCGPATESYKDQYCTDPRTMKKHAAYTEWADAYSCSRHRCQPGGRNLAIYTVGCKRVEAPESAIECEEVVEDTNMQFPYCCTRLRCLVVVRGEVWTRVLGQPWEALPAAPWSHMYKMKRPPPADGSFLPKNQEAGPIYELAQPESHPHDKVLRSAKTTEAPDCNDVLPRSVPAPDIVIALSTNSEQKEDHKKTENARQVPKYLALREGHTTKHKRIRNTPPAPYYEETEHEADAPLDMMEEQLASTDKPTELRADASEERFGNSYGVTQKASKGHQQVSWTEIPQNQWNEHDPGMDTDARDGTFNQPDFPSKEPQPSNLQALVDAIGTRMRDIETVVQRMSEKVHDATPQDLMSSAERRSQSEGESHKRHKTEAKDHQVKKPSPEAEHYKRSVLAEAMPLYVMLVAVMLVLVWCLQTSTLMILFCRRQFSVRNRGSKYLHTTDSTTEPPLFVEDTNMNGYFSDASNSVLRRNSGPKEPAQTYMAPVETRRKHIADSSDDSEKKHKKHTHKKKKNKHGHKKHHGKEEKRKRFNRLSSVEIEKNVVSLEDSSAVGSK